MLCRADSLKRLLKLTNLWQDSLRKKKRKSSDKIGNEREVATDTTEIKRLTQEYYERLYATKFNNLEKNGQLSGYM